MKRFSILSLIVLIAILAAGAARSSATSPPAVGAASAVVDFPLAPFNATGLPSASAMGMPLHKIFPAGFTLKHIHGGPAYVYVIKGSCTLTDSHGTRTYQAGSFFWEPGGYVHTFHAITATEVFVLVLLPPGAQWLVAVQ